jgi:hypothetical protein
MIKCEIREHYDSYNTGNFTEDRTRRDSFEISEEKFERVRACHEAIGRRRIETSKAIIYEAQRDARHITEYIYYK